MIFIFFLGFILYLAAAVCTSYATAPGSPDYWIYICYGLILGASTNMLWFHASATVRESGGSMVLYGLLWDTMLTAVYLGTYLLLTQSKLSLCQWAGCACLIAGLVLVKIGVK